MAVCQFFGLAPEAHHAASILFHIANTILLFLVLLRMTSRTVESAFVAALFALHPAHVESVVWIAERKDVLSTFFWILTMAAWCRYVRTKTTGSYALAAMALAAGLVAKPMLVTLPFILLLLDMWPLERRDPIRRLLTEKIPLFAIAAASSVVTYIVQARSGSVQSAAMLPFSSRFQNAFLATAGYLWRTIWPAHLAVFYPYPRRFEPGAVGLAALLVFGFSAAAVMLRKSAPWFFAGWFWFLGSLVPVIGLIQVGQQGAADRYTYVPLIGIFIAVVWGASSLVRSQPVFRNALLFTGGIATLLCACVSYAQVGTWKDSITLWTHAIAATADDYVAHRNLGLAYAGIGRDDDARREYEASLAVNPDYANAHLALAELFERLGETDDAITHYREVARLQPGNSGAQNALGAALDRAGRSKEATVAYAGALTGTASDATLETNLALSLFKSGNTDQAIAHYEKALSFGSPTAELQNNYAVALLKARRSREALEHFREAIRLQPDKVKTIGYLAWLLATNRDPALRNGAEAVTLASRACELSQRRDPVMLDTLAAAYAESGRFEPAVAAANEALTLVRAAGHDDLARGIEARLVLYRGNQPFHEGAH